MAAAPPRTPPTIAPVFELLSDEGTGVGGVTSVASVTGVGEGIIGSTGLGVGGSSVIISVFISTAVSVFVTISVEV